MVRSSFLLSIIVVFILTAGSTVGLASETLEAMKEMMSAREDSGSKILDKVAEKDKGFALLLKASPEKIRSHTEEVAGVFLPKLSDYMSIEDPVELEEEAHNLAEWMFDGKAYDYNVQLLLISASMEVLDEAEQARISKLVAALHIHWKWNLIGRIIKIGAVSVGAILVSHTSIILLEHFLHILGRNLCSANFAGHQFAGVIGKLITSGGSAYLAVASVGATNVILYRYFVHHLFRLNPAVVFVPDTRDKVLQAMKKREPVSLGNVQYIPLNSKKGKMTLNIDGEDLIRQ